MHLEDPELADAHKIQDLVTYDVVPELEQQIHQMSKRLHSALDEQAEMIADHDNLNAAGGSGEDGDEDAGEEVKGEDDDEEDERENQHKRGAKKSSKKSKTKTKDDDGERDIAERIAAIVKEREDSEKELDEATELKQKYKIGSRVYEEYIS